MASTGESDDATKQHFLLLDNFLLRPKSSFIAASQREEHIYPLAQSSNWLVHEGAERGREGKGRWTAKKQFPAGIRSPRPTLRYGAPYIPSGSLRHIQPTKVGLPHVESDFDSKFG